MLSQLAQSCNEFFCASIKGTIRTISNHPFSDIGIEIGKGQYLIYSILVQPNERTLLLQV